MSTKIKKLVTLLAKLPGIGPRQATRLALDLIDWPAGELEQLSSAIGELREGPLLCQQCFNFADDKLCRICANTKRDQTQVAVVERITDLESMEKTGAYRGVYHVLGGSLNPIEGVLDGNLKIQPLLERITRLKKLTNDIEIILATNPNTLGETTALYLEEELKPLDITVTRLARGLAAGSSLEYADEITLTNALKHRR